MIARLCACSILALAGAALSAEASTEAEQLAQQVIDRPTNEGRIGEMKFVLTDDSGRTRKRTATLVHSDEDEAVRIAIHFTAPAAIANTAFLSHDYRSSTDETWLFLPATERVRRLPSSDRGDAFMGTDLSYGDVKDNFKFQLDDWSFTGGEQIVHNGAPVLRLEGAAHPEAAEETGYGSFEAFINPDTLFPTEVLYTDQDGAELKKVEVLELEQIEGAWTAMHFRVENLQTGHSTDVKLSDVQYVADIDQDFLDPEFLEDGAPDL